jgi:hypothetical protein
MRPAIKWICPKGCFAHQDRKIDTKTNKQYGQCRQCNSISMEAK